MMKVALSVVVAVIGLLLAVPVWAHHAFGAEFDVNKPLKLRGRPITTDEIEAAINWGRD